MGVRMAKRKKDSPVKVSVIESEADDDRWRAECDLRTLIQAEEIKADRRRELKARALARKEASKMKKVAGRSGKAG